MHWVTCCDYQVSRQSSHYCYPLPLLEPLELDISPTDSIHLTLLETSTFHTLLFNSSPEAENVLDLVFSFTSPAADIASPFRLSLLYSSQSPFLPCLSQTVHTSPPVTAISISSLTWFNLILLPRLNFFSTVTLESDEKNVSGFAIHTVLLPFLARKTIKMLTVLALKCLLRCLTVLIPLDFDLFSSL